MRRVRALASFVAALACVVVLGCGGDSSGTTGNSQTDVPPSSCMSPCMVGAICTGPAEPACAGTWYCWSDTKWHCAPPDSGGVGGFPPDATPSDASPGEDASMSEASGG
jgi:hypothetical protein